MSRLLVYVRCSYLSVLVGAYEDERLYKIIDDDDHYSNEVENLCEDINLSYDVLIYRLNPFSDPELNEQQQAIANDKFSLIKQKGIYRYESLHKYEVFH